MTARCATQISSIGPCNTPLIIDVLPGGRTRETCPRCAARADGRCWQCGRPRTNHREFGVYCEPCRQAAVKRTYRRCQQSPEYQAWLRAYLADRRQHDAGYRERRREANRRWCEQNAERRAEYNRRWRQENADRVKRYQRQSDAKRSPRRQQEGAA